VTDQLPRPDSIEPPDGPDVAPAEPAQPDGEEFSRPGGDEFDGHVARQPGGPDQIPVENLDGIVDRDRLSAPNQGFRTGG
jgi:hypothetical protein